MTPKEFISLMKTGGEATKVSRSQLPELAAKGITEAMLVELGVEIVDDADIEPDSIVICPSAQDFYYADNVFTVCAQCGGAIQHRPSTPARLKKVCIKCAQDIAQMPHGRSL